MKKRLIIVDVSNFIFRAFFAIRRMNSPEGVPVNAVYGVLSMFLKLFSNYRPTHILMAKDTSGGSFRNEIYDEYKANRSEPPEDLIPQFALIQELLEKMGTPISKDEKYEADDIIGSAVVQFKDQFDEVLIASGDKDLMQFVGENVKILDTMKDRTFDEKGVFEKMGVRPDQIVDYLSMVGDSSDNVPGMKGIGAKGAAKLLAEHDTLEKCIEVKDTFKGKKLTNAFENHIDDALLSKELVTIVTDVDIKLGADDLAYQFYPTDELMEFLRSLSFKSLLNKMEDLKRAEAHADDADGEAQFGSVEVGALSKIETSWVEKKTDFEKVLELIDSNSGISFHTEYDSEDIVDRQILSISISIDGEKGYVLSFMEGSELGETERDLLFEKTLLSENVELAGEHWKRDLAFCEELKSPAKCQRFDIVQAHFVANPGENHTLPRLAKKYLSFELVERPKKNPIIKEFEKEEHEKFAGLRAALIFKLAEELKAELKEKSLESVYYELDDLLTPILSRIERMGVQLNQGFFEEYEATLAAKISALEEKIHAQYDGDPINLNSPKQVGELLFVQLELPVIKKTKTGYSTDVEVLEKLDAKNVSPIPALLLQYRELNKLQSTYVKTLPSLVNANTGRLHTHFNQHVAATGRLASNNPNLQNIPIRTEAGREIRKGFIAKPGMVLLGADYSQVELRLLAHFSGDKTMIDAFNNDQDIHRQTASEVMGVSLEDVTSEERSKAKAVNFGLMYGQSSFGLAAQLKISRSEAKEYITTYFERFSQVKTYLDTLKEKAEKTGYAETLIGRKRFLPDIHSKNRTMKAMAERVAINSPIQGTAADIIKMAMVKIDQKMKEEKLKSKMILQVHDELIFEVPEKELETMKTLVREGMENVVDLKIPLKVDMGIGVNWYDLK